MKAAKYDLTGKAQGEVELPDNVFKASNGPAVIYEVVRAELKNRRQGTHKTKTISEISGGGKKPYKQKGTGNARQGSTRATQFRGGQTVFGPLPRDYQIKIGQKKRKAGIRSILSTKAEKQIISVVADDQSVEYNTKKYAALFKGVGFGDKSSRLAYIVDNEDIKLKKSISNIEGVELIQAKRLTAPELYYSDCLLIAESALPVLSTLYQKQAKA